MKAGVVFLDMDGVLADFDQGIKDATGHYPSEFGTTELPRRIMWEAIQFQGSGFFRSLNPLPEGLALYRALKRTGVKVVILTADGGHEASRRGKAAWAADWLEPKQAIAFVSDGAEKAIFAHPNALLIDDRLKAVEPFRKAGGGAILWPSARRFVV